MNKKKPVGRPRLSEGEKTVAAKISILPSQFAYLKQIGGENLSLGVRIVTDAHKKECVRCFSIANYVGKQIVLESWREALGRDHTYLYDCPQCGAFIEPADSQKLRDAGLMEAIKSEG